MNQFPILETLTMPEAPLGLLLQAPLRCKDEEWPQWDAIHHEVQQCTEVDT